jgi:Uracil DNA glycosylase superfamily
MRKSTEVIETLLIEMNCTVLDYHVSVMRTGQTLKELIAGTAMFPGGAGLWRGGSNGGPLPEHFPEKPVMFIGHNFDSINAHDKAIRAKGEVDSTFWTNLRAFMQSASLDPANCFFTNALMGLKPDSATGTMPTAPNYEAQCLQFLFKQVEIAAPRAVVTLGGEAQKRWERLRKLHSTLRAIPSVNLMHPSARPLNQRPTRESWIHNQGESVSSVLSANRR